LARWQVFFFQNEAKCGPRIAVQQGGHERCGGLLPQRSCSLAQGNSVPFLLWQSYGTWPELWKMARPYTNDRSTLQIQDWVFSIDVLDYRTVSHKKICVFIARSVLVAGTALDPKCLQLCPKRPASVLLRQHNACYRCLNEITQIHMCRHIRR
jgi:hypothetical protein